MVDRARVERITRSGGVTEADLNGHLQNANGGKENGSVNRKNNGGEDLQVRDNQLYEALSLLKGLNIMAQNKRANQQQPTTANKTANL